MKNGKIYKTILSLITAGVLHFSLVPEALADYASFGDNVVTNREVAVYDSGKDEHEQIAIISEGTDLERILANDNYTLVRIDKNLGFVPNDGLTSNGNNHEQYSYEEMYESGLTTTGVNLRTGPSTDYDIIDTLKTGTRIEILGKSNNGWYLVDFNNRLGFMCSNYIDIVDFDKVSENLPDVIPAVTATAVVNIRSEASTRSEDLGDLYPGDSLPMFEKVNDDWYQVEYNGGTAYVSAKYVTESYMIDDDLDKVAYCSKEDTPIYGSTNGDVSFRAPKYEAVYVYSDEGEYYYAMVDGVPGFVRKSDVTLLSGRFVIVDISDQKLKLFKDDKDNILTCSVVTGKDKSPTSIGCFKARTPVKDTYLVGPGYKSHVDYWIAFNGGQGLHDASWRDTFGGTIYHKKGSHGCVNMPHYAAEITFNTLKKGDKVLVKK